MNRNTVLGICLAVMVSTPAQAGQPCTETAPTAEKFALAAKAAKATYAALEYSDAETVILARVGSDVSQYGLYYTHAGLALRQHAERRWVIRQMLNTCATKHSSLFDQGLLNFFLDNPHKYEALILIPRKDMQAKLRNVALSPTSQRLHQRAYSMIANPYATKYQNSNQWLLEVIAAAQAPAGGIESRAEAQRYLQANGYRPSVVRISPFRRLAASVVRANIQFDGHTETASRSHRYPFVSVRSLRDYMWARGEIVEEVKVAAQ